MVFVPNSEGPLAIKFQKEGYDKLEQYLRATENADHANWIDEDGFGIINRMKITTSKTISDFYQGNDSEKQSSATSGISRKFGKLFLPPKIMEELLQVRDKIVLILETQVIRID